MNNIIKKIKQGTAAVLRYFWRSKAFFTERHFISRSKKERLLENGAFCFLKVQDLNLTENEYKRVFVLQKQLAIELHTIELRREADGVCVSQKSEKKPIGFQLKSTQL